MKIKLIIAAATLAMGSTAFASNAQVSDIEVLMVNVNPHPAKGDRVAFRDNSSDQCSYFGKVVDDTASSGLQVAINRKRCGSGEMQPTQMAVQVPSGEIAQGTIFVVREAR
jgi:hypothetical protein